MNIEEFRNYCLLKNSVEEDTPFGPDTLVFKIAGKMFALTSLSRMPTQVNLKCDPDKALELRDQYDGVIPGYHMSKKHWNTVILESDVEENLLLKMIDDSYDLVVGSLPKKIQAELKSLSK